MKFLHILVCCLLWHNAWAYYTAEQLEQIEQKYESPIESEDQDYFANPGQSATIETLNQALSQLEPTQVKSASGIPQSLLSSPSSYSGSSLANSPYDSGLKSLEGKSSEYSKVTQIPSGTLFSMSDKGPGPLEFESPFSKQPYSIVFRTHSMPVKIKQQHQTLPAPEVEFVRSQEEAHRIKHEVVRPVIQEVHEIIQPYRKIVQEVRPVQESIHTIVSKGEGRGQRAGGQAAAGSNGGFGSEVSGGHSSNGQLSVGYSENMPRFAPPQQQKPPHFRAHANHVPAQSQSYGMPQYSSVVRGSSHHFSRY